jgi:hypothetical protein
MAPGWTCQRDGKRIQRKGGKKLKVLNEQMNVRIGARELF